MPDVSHQPAVSRYLISMYILHLPLCQLRERHDRSCRASFHTARGVTVGVAGRHSTPRAAAPSQEAGRALNLARSPPNEWGQARFVGSAVAGSHRVHLRANKRLKALRRRRQQSPSVNVIDALGEVILVRDRVHARAGRAQSYCQAQRGVRITIVHN
jgi:hypothetical protein